MIDINTEFNIRQWVRYQLGQTRLGISIYGLDFSRKDVQEIIRDELSLLEKIGAITVFDMDEFLKRMQNETMGFSST